MLVLLMKKGLAITKLFKKIKLLNLLSADLNEVDYDLAYLELWREDLLLLRYVSFADKKMKSQCRNPQPRPQGAFPWL